MKEEYSDTVFRGSYPTGGRPAKFAIVTACNPDGQDAAPGENAEATALLSQDLMERGLVFSKMLGGSRDWQHVEEGFLIVCDLQTSIRLGRAYHQDAVFWVEGDEMMLVSCKDSQIVGLGSWEKRYLGTSCDEASE